MTIRHYLRAFARAYTYDPRNLCLWFGLAWGAPIPLFALALNVAPAGLAFFLLHPLAFAVIFGAVGTVRRDLEEQNRRLIETLRTCAMTDALTGLYNRRHALEELTNMLARARRTERPVSVALFDVDDFKPVNETRGHLEGDRVLHAISQALKSAVRDGDLIARYGGDEFLLVVESDTEGAAALARRTVEIVRGSTGFTLSVGVATWPGDGCTPEALVGAADGRMAGAKRETKRRTRAQEVSR